MSLIWAPFGPSLAPHEFHLGPFRPSWAPWWHTLASFGGMLDTFGCILALGCFVIYFGVHLVKFGMHFVHSFLHFGRVGNFIYTRLYSLKGPSAQNPPIRGSAGPRWRWKLANRRPLHDGELSCPSCSRPRFSRSLRRRALADPPIVRLSRRAPMW